MGNRVNPRRVPRTQKDVDAAYDRGITEGLHRGIELMLYVLIDKHAAPHGRRAAAGPGAEPRRRVRG